MQAIELQTQLIEEIKQSQKQFFETYISKSIKLPLFTPLNRDDIYER
jgi:hypothetical protein